MDEAQEQINNLRDHVGAAKLLAQLLRSSDLEKQKLIEQAREGLSQAWEAISAIKPEPV
jgi:CHAD domain-containing protein